MNYVQLLCLAHRNTSVGGRCKTRALVSTKSEHTEHSVVQIYKEMVCTITFKQHELMSSECNLAVVYGLATH